MASPSSSVALILFNPHIGTLVKRSEERDPDKRWALTFSGFTGRSLDRVYTVWGHALEKQANRIAHKMGMGSDATTQKLAVYFGNGQERLLKLEGLRTSTPPKVRDYCRNLMKYTLPTGAPATQLRAFKNVVHLCTRFLGLRAVFLGCKCMQDATPAASISELWTPSPCLEQPSEEWLFWQGLAAACLSETIISTLLEDTPVAELTHCSEEGLSVIERFLVVWDCSADSKFSAALCVRYLGGILDLPGFWSDVGNVHSNVAEKLCCQMIRALKDVGVDILQLGSLDETDPPFDYDGLDSLAATILVGLSSWFEKLDEKERPLQPWYNSLREILGLLRAPRSVDLLPQASAYAVDTWEALLPLRSQSAEVDVTAICEDADASGDENTVVDSNADTPLASVIGVVSGDNPDNDDSAPTLESNNEELASDPPAPEDTSSVPSDPSTSNAPSSVDPPKVNDAATDEAEVVQTADHAEQSEVREDSMDYQGDLEQPVPECSDLSLPSTSGDVSDGQATDPAGEDSGGDRDHSSSAPNQGDAGETIWEKGDVSVETSDIPRDPPAVAEARRDIEISIIPNQFEHQDEAMISGIKSSTTVALYNTSAEADAPKSLVKQPYPMPSVRSMDQQPEIRWHMRPIIVDFLVETHFTFRLRPEVLYLTLNIVDRYLSRRITYIKHYQLLGCAAFWIAAKFADPGERVPTCQDLAQICRETYEESAFIKMEGHVLSTIQWALWIPTAPARFRVMCIGPYRDERKVRHVARFLMEITLFYREFVECSPSSITLAVLTLARFLCGEARRVAEETDECFNVVDHLDTRLANQVDEPVSEVLVKKYSYTFYSKAAPFVVEYYLHGGRYVKPTPASDSAVTPIRPPPFAVRSSAEWKLHYELGSDAIWLLTDMTRLYDHPPSEPPHHGHTITQLTPRV